MSVQYILVIAILLLSINYAIYKVLDMEKKNFPNSDYHFMDSVLKISIALSILYLIFNLIMFLDLNRLPVVNENPQQQLYEYRDTGTTLEDTEAIDSKQKSIEESEKLREKKLQEFLKDE